MTNEKHKTLFWIEINKEGKTTAIGGYSTAKQIKTRGIIPTSEELNYG